KGEQLLDKKEQLIDYTLSENGVTISLKGDMSFKDGEINDSVKLASDSTELLYESEETLEDNTREYERIFSVDSSFEGKTSFIWNGEATYDKDKMSSENSFALESPDLSQDMLQLHVSKDAKTV